MKESTIQAKLIYGDYRPSEKLFEGYIIHTNLDSADELHQLKRDDLQIVKDPRLMRSRDIRSDEPGGIVLLLTKSFTIMRNVKQAFGRVGKFDEPCLRYKLRSLRRIWTWMCT